MKKILKQSSYGLDIGKTEQLLIRKRADNGVLHFSLVDPHKTGLDQAELIGEEMSSLGTDAFLVGGSLGVSPQSAYEVIEALKKTGLPVIIFPGDLGNLAPNADAILFLSLLNSSNPYFIVGAQVQGALLIAKYNLEAIPTAYLIIGHGGAAGFMGHARPIPWEQYDIAAAYALAGYYMGMRFTYLEAGSGAPRSISPEMVARVKQIVNRGFLIVGGGIRDDSSAKKLADSGADAIVTGTIIEKDIEKAKRIIKALKKTG